MIERWKSFSTPPRRKIASVAMKAFWPIEFREGTRGNLEAFNNVLAEGNGTVGLVPHFSMGDFLTILTALARNSKEFRKRQILIPIAAHQRPFYLDWICRFGNVTLTTVITDDTKQKEAQLKAAGKPIPWKGLNESHLRNLYLSRAVKTLQQGGTVIFAPQGGRRNSLYPFKEDHPVKWFELATRRNHIKNLAFFSIGLEIAGENDYSKLNGLNLRKPYIVTLGPITERKNINGDLDIWAYDNMLDLAPPAYRPAA